jgi:hypothetical protein
MKTKLTTELVEQIAIVDGLRNKMQHLENEYRNSRGKLETKLLLWERRARWTRAKLEELSHGNRQKTRAAKNKKATKA